MESKPIRNKLTPAQVCDQMSDCEPVTFRTPMTWQQALNSQAPGASHIGEIRAEGDWDKVPREQHLRAVCVTDHAGQVIRWGDGMMHEVLGGDRPMIDLFFCRGETFPAVRRAYIYVSSEGEIQIHP